MKEGYLPLYRKYRPQKLEDIVGQSHIKLALKNAIELDRISHAYLFTGPRGTGKTSTARILAKSLNCVNGPTINPCEECESCKAITNTVPIDVIEIDAASNRSVDDAHEILEKVQYAPVNGKYKIYIIDEVHMLTTQAFNALLKTLEEPPKNVIFILATTEAHKVLDTIKSRCQRFDFKRITTDDIIHHLKKIAEKENINISDNAISVIAKSSCGGMRDSLALLDQVSTLGSSKEITEEDINNLLGRLSFDSLRELSSCIIKSDGASAVNVLEKIYNDGNEPIQILINLMFFFKNMLIIKTCDFKTSVELTGFGEQQLKQLEEAVDSLEKHQIVFLINKTADYIREMKETTNQQLWLEVGLIDLSNLANNTKLSELEARISALENGGSIPQNPRPVVRQVVSAQSKQSNTAPVHNEPVVSGCAEEAADKSANNTVQDKPLDEHIVKEDVVQEVQPKKNADIKTLWVELLKAIPNQPDRALFNIANPVKIAVDGIIITFKAPSFVEKANMPAKKQCISEAAAVVLGKQDIPVLVRSPLPDDAKIEKVKISQPKKNMTPPIEITETVEVDSSEIDTVNEVSKEPALEDKSNRSDQSNMVRELFDGKYLD